MQKKLIIGIWLFLSSILVSYAQSGSTSLYRFSNAVQHNGQNVVLHHNLSVNSAELAPASSATFNAQDGYLQAFVLQRLAPDSILIASAKSKSHFLKYNSSTGQISFAPLEADRTPFLWQINYAGFSEVDHVLISPTNAPNQSLYLNTDGSLSLERQRNASGTDLPANNAGNIDNRFRFLLERITNVF